MIQNDKTLGLCLISFHDNGHAWWNHLLLLLLLMQTPTPATSQLQEPPVEPINNKSTLVIMSIVAVMFLISGFLSLYSHQCAGRQTRVQSRLDPNMATSDPDLGRRSHSESLGLNQEAIDTFPTFLYSSVKGLKIGTCALACAVCLSEFQDEETLRLIPKCSHVFHLTCIDVWLASHSTCPVCRANLVPGQDDVVSLSPMLSIQIPNDQEEEQENNVDGSSEGRDHKRDSENDVESSKDDLLRRSRTVNHVIAPTRSRSTGFLCALLFPRSNSTDHPVTVHACDDEERFTLRLPDEVRIHVLKNSTLKRTKSCVGFARMSCGTKGYRTRSVGGGGGRSYFKYGRFDGTTPFFAWNWSRSARQSCSVFGGSVG